MLRSVTSLLRGRVFIRTSPVSFLPGVRCVSCSNESRSSERWRPELIVFDKCGTLFNIHAVWVPWTHAISHRLEAVTGLTLRDKIQELLNVCIFTQKIGRGVLADGTTSQIQSALINLLTTEDISHSQAVSAIATAWIDPTVSNPETITQLSAIKSLFQTLQDDGTQIAVCSSDSRQSTLQALRRSELIGLVDHVTCGDNGGEVRDVCQALSVRPDRTVVVGDTVEDMQLGHAADVAVTVGVLSGIGTRLQLKDAADVIAEDILEAVDIVKQLTPSCVGEMGKKRQDRRDSEKADLVIFDKDGTLVCFSSMWTPWVELLVQRLEAATGLALEDTVPEALGFCIRTKTWKPSVFTVGTTKQSHDSVVDVLSGYGYDRPEAESLVTRMWPSAEHHLGSDQVRVFDDPASLFRTLQSQGVRVAVCTSDCRHGTETLVRTLRAQPYVDLLLCGDDPDTEPKPAAHNALKICRELDVDPARTVVVGDTHGDMGMGRAARLGATVAVLTGVGDLNHLGPDADHVVPSISYVIDVVIPPEDRRQVHEMYRSHVAASIGVSSTE